MPLDYEILRQHGTHQERLREIFTATTERIRPEMSEEEKENIRADVAMRTKIQDLIASRIDESILNNLRRSHLFSAVDLAWDSSTITRQTVPLVMFAQGMINQDECVKELKDISCADKYVRHGDEKKPILDLPRITEVNVNIVRAIVTRRVAAQAARYSNLWPYFKYEPRGWSDEDKMRGDLMSTIVDVQADQFGYRESGVQTARDMLLYPYCVEFPASRWEREIEWVRADGETAEELKTETSDGKIPIKARVKREGVPTVIPHPSRVFWDIAHSITSINSDTGCEFFGWWDVVRFRDIEYNPEFWNMNTIGFSNDMVSLFGRFQTYWTQYYTTISPPVPQPGMAAGNDPKSILGLYSSAYGDCSIFVTHFYWKITPNQWRMGGYPFPVWLHLIVANSNVVVFAEIMPDCPGFVYAYNNSNQRLYNLSMAHELLPWQDQLTQLFTSLVETVKAGLFGIAILNTDAFPVENEESKKALEQFRMAMKSENFFAKVSAIEVSLIKMRELGVDMDKIFKIVRDNGSSEKINEIVKAIIQTIAAAERMMVLSPQEQAQPIPRETSATEVQIMAGSTETIYQFISDAIDSGRAAKKRYIYNAWYSLGSDEIRVPVAGRYSVGTAERLGLKIETAEGGTYDPNTPGEGKYTVVGKKHNLACEFIFNSRDGIDRASNIQAAQTLTGLLTALLQPGAMQSLTRGQFARIISAIIRQSGAGIDVVIEPPAGTEDQTMMPDPAQQPQMPPGAPQGAIGAPPQGVAPPQPQAPTGPIL